MEYTDKELFRQAQMAFKALQLAVEDANRAGAAFKHNTEIANVKEETYRKAVQAVEVRIRGGK